MGEEEGSSVARAPTVYLLHSTSAPRCTYVGSTIHGVARRLRQHNGELSGGATQTARHRPWRVVLTITGFHTRQQALQFEFAWRRVHRRMRAAYTLDGRRTSLDALRRRERWSSRAPLASEVPLRVHEEGNDPPLENQR